MFSLEINELKGKPSMEPAFTTAPRSSLFEFIRLGPQRSSDLFLQETVEQAAAMTIKRRQIADQDFDAVAIGDQ